MVLVATWRKITGRTVAYRWYSISKVPRYPENDELASVCCQPYLEIPRGNCSSHVSRFFGGKYRKYKTCRLEQTSCQKIPCNPTTKSAISSFLSYEVFAKLVREGNCFFIPLITRFLVFGSTTAKN